MPILLRYAKSVENIYGASGIRLDKHEVLIPPSDADYLTLGRLMKELEGTDAA